ncbi:MAG: hypothetical protein EDM03_09490 [Porphyrobacter sp. IPPAS B-1204]|nr:MAG: hypothetical protein EDM03_08585 [Porphyrobacter sp. IPPAS B-1204]RNJ62852.1 MAG: hypothetical protein EDM03_09490 [Porphyrobacter sp. IPPAS B-1204]
MAWFLMMDSRNRGDEDETYLSPEILEIPEELERFEAMGKALGQQLSMASRSLGRSTFDTTWMIENPWHPLWDPWRYPPLMQGWRWPIPDTPFRARLRKPQKHIVDVISSGFDGYAISQRAIDIIEAIEPGVHQYLPFELINPDGSVHSEPRWLLNVCTRAFTLNIVRSNVIVHKQLPGIYVHTSNDIKLVVHKEKVAGRALWYEYRYQGAQGMFLMSDACWSAFQAAGISGLRPDYFDRGKHIEEL